VSDHVGCHKDLVCPGQTGEIFPFGDYKVLADLLVSFASKSERVRSMGKRAKQKVADYSVENVVKGCIEAIKYVCQGAEVGSQRSEN
jgi:glycosyltransferase involved in cell wall biosynthesis